MAESSFTRYPTEQNNVAVNYALLMCSSTTMWLKKVFSEREGVRIIVKRIDDKIRYYSGLKSEVEKRIERIVGIVEQIKKLEIQYSSLTKGLKMEDGHIDMQTDEVSGIIFRLNQIKSSHQKHLEDYDLKLRKLKRERQFYVNII